jgi:hypothetical protein
MSILASGINSLKFLTRLNLDLEYKLIYKITNLNLINYRNNEIKNFKNSITVLFENLNEL